MLKDYGLWDKSDRSWQKCFSIVLPFGMIWIVEWKFEERLLNTFILM